MRGMDDRAEAKYLDQINDACTILGARDRQRARIDALPADPAVMRAIRRNEYHAYRAR